MAGGKDSLRNFMREGDALKKEVDAFAVESQGVIEDMGLADRKQRMQKLLQRSKDLMKKANKVEQKVSKHTKGKEPNSINRFDEVKADELKRLRNLKNRLEKLKESLVPDETEEEYFRQAGNKKASASTSKVVSVKPGINSTLEEMESEDDDDEDEDEEEHHQEREEEDKEEVEEEDGEGEEEEEGETKETPPPKAESKLRRLSLFRRSSRSAKDTLTKPKESGSGTVGETKKERKEREKQEKLAEKERREQEKRDKREKERQEKEKKEKEKKEQKKAKEDKKGTGKGKTVKISSTMDEVSEQSEEEGGADEEENEEVNARDDRDEEEDDDNDDDDDGDDDDDDDDVFEPKSPESSPKLSPKRSLRSPFGRKHKSSEKSGSGPSDVPKPPKEKRGSGGWKLFQRKTDRKMKSSTGGEAKEKETPAKEPMGRKEEKKTLAASKLAAALEDDDEDDEDEDDDEEDEEDDDEEYEEDGSVEDEEEEDISGEEEEVEDEEEEDDEEEDEEEDDEEEDEDEEDDEDDEEYKGELGGTGGSNVSDGVFSPPDEGMERFEAVCDFAPEQTEDLGFRRGDVLTILNTREDGWWMAEDEEGNRGLVPSTYLKLKKDYSDFRDLQSPEHEDKERAQGARRKSGVELWKGLRKAMTETSVTDVLTAMGAIPSGFRPSTTAKLLKEDHFTLCHVLKPHLSTSNLAFKDLFWNPKENQVRARPVRVQKMISIVMIKNMPQVGAGLETRSRHVRVALFDGDKVLSNIHTVQANYVESDPKTWKFSPKMTGMLPSSLDGDCFVRTNNTDENIGLLFEICLSYVRTKTGEKGEFGCGWVHLPLFDEATGAPVVNKVYEMPIKGGTPYEQDVDVDPSISRKASTSKFRSMMTVNKMPRLVVKLVTPTKEQKAELDTLPDTVISSACYISALSMYRKVLADALLTDRIDLQNADLIHSPVLASFPKATLYPDIMDALRSCWSDKKRSVKKSDKRDLGQMKKLFSDACMESVYPLLHSATLPPYKFGDTQNNQDRWEEISGLMKQNRASGILHYLLKPGVMHTPLDIAEVTFDLLGVYGEKS